MEVRLHPAFCRTSNTMPRMGDSFITTTGADTSGAQYRQKPVVVIILLGNPRDFPEIITSTGAKFSCSFCPSVLVLVIFQAPKKESHFWCAACHGQTRTGLKDLHWRGFDMLLSDPPNWQCHSGSAILVSDLVPGAVRTSAATGTLKKMFSTESFGME